jgi:hypothetical protein
VASRTLETLVAVARTRPVARELCCPDCGGGIELKGGLYHCLGVPYDVCRFEPTTTLAGLAVVDSPGGGVQKRSPLGAWDEAWLA